MHNNNIRCQECSKQPAQLGAWFASLLTITGLKEEKHFQKENLQAQQSHRRLPSFFFIVGKKSSFQAFGKITCIQHELMSASFKIHITCSKPALDTIFPSLYYYIHTLYTLDVVYTHRYTCSGNITAQNQKL